MRPSTAAAGVILLISHGLFLWCVPEYCEVARGFEIVRIGPRLELYHCNGSRDFKGRMYKSSKAFCENAAHEHDRDVWNLGYVMYERRDT